MRLILIGPPGSGKGTQAALLCARLHLTPIGTGDILREAVRQKTPLGIRAEPYIKNGHLVPDDLVNQVVIERFRRDDRPESFVMDGYPRTVAQAESFDEVLREQFLDLTAVLLFEVPDEEIVRRMSGRLSCPRCKATYHRVSNPPREPNVCDVCHGALIERSDDREETVRERLRIYHETTEGIAAYFRAQGLLHEVSGTGSIEQIYARILEALNQAIPPC
jgi:adenylate kinase